jgi:arylsulfatase A-like enzyme
MHTPNIDALAAKSLVLTKNYVQQAVCSPTRTSMLTGRRPDRTRVYDLYSYFRTVGGNYTTVPEFFKQKGYQSVGMGKVRVSEGGSSRNGERGGRGKVQGGEEEEERKCRARCEYCFSFSILTPLPSSPFPPSH